MSLLLVTTSFPALLAQKLPREQWGAPAVSVTHSGGNWIIVGKRTRVTLNESDLSLRVQAGAAQWTMLPSGAQDMLVKSHGKEFYLQADVRVAQSSRAS